MPMDLDIGCSFEFVVPVATHAVMLIEPHTSELDRVVEAEVHTTQADREVESFAFTDANDNRCRRITFDAGPATVRFMARAVVPDVADDTVEDAPAVPPRDLPGDVLPYLLPSRYCESDQLTELAWTTFGTLPPGWPVVQGISDWVHERLEFRYGSSSPSYSAMNVLEQGLGVCRDFTHLAIGFCRALNLPARYAFGYLPDIGVPDPGTPMDFCAWMEVYLGDRWYTFDPRNNQRRVGRVVIGRGRDAADVAMVTSFGRLELAGMLVRAAKGEGTSWNDGGWMLEEAARSSTH